LWNIIAWHCSIHFFAQTKPEINKSERL
jgi:hypothetical protein